MTNIAELHWSKELNCGITVCNSEGVIVYMNEKAISSKHADLTGKNIFDCHNPHSCAIIRQMLDNGGQNIYTIEKNGAKKVIYQSAWKEDGEVKGLCEIMADAPDDIPHFVR